MSKKNKPKDKISSLQQRYPRWKFFVLGIIAVILIIAFTAAFWPSNEANTAQEGDTVKVIYRGTADDGWIFDSAGTENVSRAKQLIIGKSMNMPPGFMKALVGMHVDQTKTIRVAPEEAYGPEEIIEDISSFPPDANVSIGMSYSIVTPSGLYIEEAKVTSISGSKVVLRNLHELAGQYVNFEITLVELIKAQPAGNSSTNTSN